jgi:SAM-dependent methyltransferase
MAERPIEYALSDHSRAQHNAWLEHYRAIREAEGRGSDSPDFYLRLPDGDFGKRRAKEWTLRRESLEWLKAHLRTLESATPLRILDAGAGNCWLTRYLAEWGHDVTALDVNDDDLDGLGAGRHYLQKLPIDFRRVVADFADLPCDRESFDVIIFNGSVHYAHDLATVVEEAKRALRRNGEMIIIDSPVYHNPTAGRKMMSERGNPGRARFLTYRVIQDIASRLNLDLEIYARPRTFPGRAKRLMLRAMLRREPASMPWIVLRRPLGQ